MGVYIKGMEMPKRCGGCFLRVGECKQRIYMEDRPHDCPLVHVPPHGRLVDADRLLSEYMKRMYYHLPNGDTAIPIIDVENAPTIIPAEEGE